jgi:hypothetical protein
MPESRKLEPEEVIVVRQQCGKYFSAAAYTKQ